MLRHAIATVAALTVTAALAPSAHAWTTRFTFATERGAPARVIVESPYDNTRLELVRNGVVVRHGITDELEISGLVKDDIANLYYGVGDTLLASATYDGLPIVNETACIGRSAFNVRRAADATILDAGAFEGEDLALRSVWTTGESFTVTLERPLRAGDVAYATTRVPGDIEVRSYRGVPVLDCPLPPPPPPPGPPIVTPPTPPASPAAPTDKQSQQAVKGSVAATGSSLRPLRLPRLAKRANLTLPFAFPEPGTVKLDLVAKGQTIGTGTKSSAANGKVSVSVTLTSAGRKLLKRAKKPLKVSVTGTFTPSRAGEVPQRASVSVTLRR